MSKRDDQIEKLLRTTRIGLAAIGKKFGLTAARVWQIGQARHVTRPLSPRQAALSSEDTKRQIRTLDDGGWTREQIAEHFKISAADVTEIVGRSRGRYGEEIRRRARQRYRALKNTYLVGVELGISDETVRKWCQDIIVKPRDRYYTKKQRARALRMVLVQDKSVSEAARSVGCSYTTITNWINASRGHPKKRSENDLKYNARYQADLRSETRAARQSLKRQRMAKAAKAAGRTDLEKAAKSACPMWEKCKCRKS